MKNTFSAMLAGIGGAVLLAGCASTPAPRAQCNRAQSSAAEPQEIRAVHADSPLTVDGRLDEAVWTRAPAYAMSLSADQLAGGNVLREGGRVRFAWDAENLYLAVEFEDSDVVAEGEADGEHHYQKGDVAELFLWPEAHTWYWELYVTPHGRQTSFFFPGPARMLPSTFKDHLRLRVAAQVQGTFNDWSDRDRGWTAEMAVPVKDLTRHGEDWGPGAVWRVLVGRYNYSVHLPAVELSAMPKLSRTSFHLRGEYRRLRLEPQEAGT